MSKAAHANPRTAYVEVNGEKVRPKDAYWVVLNPANKPVDFFTSDVNIRDNVASAARQHWMGDTAALLALNSGYHLFLVTKAEFVREVAPKMVEDLTPADLRTGKRNFTF